MELRALVRRSGDAAWVHRLLALAVICAGGTQRDAALAAHLAEISCHVACAPRRRLPSPPISRSCRCRPNAPPRIKSGENPVENV